MPDAIEFLIEPPIRDLGGFSGRRALPSAKRRAVGPFVFFDHMGPARFAPGEGIDVRPHPHIGLATVTYLFEGEIVHRDGLGFVQPIRPGDVNWMTAGRGIVHSERTGAEVRSTGGPLHGIQAWVGLPCAAEEAEPAFSHHPGATLPELERDGARLRFIAGTAYGQRSPIATRSPLFYVDAALAPGGRVEAPQEPAERAVYVAEGALDCGGERIGAGRIAVLAPGAGVALRALEPTRALLFGGEPLDGERILWWNFVASSRERLERAKRDWADGRFAPVPGETERIPLPAE